MTTVRYRPGDRVGIIRSGMIVIVEKVTSAALVTEIWELLSTHPTVDDVFVALTSTFDQPIHRMPSFGVVAFSKELHAILRGPLHLTTEPGPDACSISGNEGNRWSERIVPRQDFSLFSDAETPDTIDETWLPVHEAVVPFGGLRLSLGTAATPAEQVTRPAHQPDSVDVDRVLNDDATEGAHHEEDTAGIVVGEDRTDGVLDDGAVTLLSPPEPAGEETLTELPSRTLLATGDEVTDDESGSVEDRGYDYLWGHTIVRTVEDAAVRDAEEDAPALPLTKPFMPEGEPGLPPAGPTPASPPEPSPQPVSVFGDRAASPPRVPVTGLIDSVPWARETEATPPPISTDTHDVESANDDEDIEHTIIVRHGRSGGTDAHSGPEPAPDFRGRITVLGRNCSRGHANPPQQSDCSNCGELLSGEPHDVPRPSLGRVRLSTGDVVELDRPLVVGRKPAVSRVQGTDMPRLVSVSKDRAEVSRSHVEVTLEGWHVLLRDLRSSNGTVLTRQGQRPRRLDQGEITMLVTGDVVELGGAVSLMFEDLR